ncbi:MAG TPA: hypothetical protein VGJ02_06205 [Pyrinomonadaceae bacterium]|jgi:hypothetical protein
MKRIVLAMVLGAFTATAALADIAKPEKPSKPKASIDTFLHISLKSDAKEARLIIPKSQLAQLRAQLDQMGGTDDTAAASTATGTANRLPTIMGGLFLSLAIVFGGIWFARSGKLSLRTNSAIVVLIIFTAIGSAATFVYGNAGPPPEARSITGRMFTQAVHLYGFGSGQIKLETSDDPDQPLELIVPNAKEPSGEE